MSTTPTDARQSVSQLGLPRVFEDVWDGVIPRALIDWQTPESYFDVREDLERRFPQMSNCVPLWENNRNHVYALDLISGEAVVCYYYDDEDAFQVVGKNYQQLAAAYLVDCIYAGEEDLDAIATILDFRYVDRLRAFLEEDHSHLSARETKRRFVASIPVT